MKRVKRNDQEKISRINWWKLKGEKERNFERRILQEVICEAQGSANELWNEMAKRTKKVAKETLGDQEA